MGSNSVTLAAAQVSHSHRGACLLALTCVCTPVTVQVNTTDSCVLSSVTVKGNTDLKQRLRMKRQRRKHCNWWWWQNRTTEGWKPPTKTKLCVNIQHISGLYGLNCVCRGPFCGGWHFFSLQWWNSSWFWDSINCFCHSSSKNWQTFAVFALSVSFYVIF